MNSNIRAIVNYAIALLVLYGAYVNTGGFFSITVFYLWIICGMLAIISMALSIDSKADEVLYGIAKERGNYPRSYYFGLDFIEFSTIFVLAYNAHYFYATMMLVAWFMAESMLRKVRKFDVAKYEVELKAREEWRNALQKRLDDIINS